MKALSNRLSVNIDPLFTNYKFLNDTMLFADDYAKTNNDKHIVAEQNRAYAFQGNLFGLFKEMGLHDNLHMLIMQYNGIDSPHDYDGIKTIFYVPVVDIYNKLYKLS